MNEEHQKQFAAYRDYRERILDEAKNGKPADWPPIWDLLDMADFAIRGLLWLAENRGDDVKRYARERHEWPVFHSTLPSIEKRFRKAAKSVDFGKSLPFKVGNQTKYDTLFSVARCAVEYLSGTAYGYDSYMPFYFARFIRNVDRPDSKLVDKKIKINQYRMKLGALNRKNWPKWKPLFENYMTLRYGPTWLRWERIPTRWQENVTVATHFGVCDEWFSKFGRAHKITRPEFDAIPRVVESRKSKPIYDWQGDSSIAATLTRGQKRERMWSDFKEKLLKRCEQMLPER